MHKEIGLTKLSETVLEKSKSMAQTNAETLHSLLVGIENLGENVKNMQEEMVAWQSGYQDAEREYQNMNEQILQEVSLPAPAVRPEGSVNPHQYLYLQSVPPSSLFHLQKMYHGHQDSLLDKQLVNLWMKTYKPGGLKSQHSGNHILVHLHQQIGVPWDLM